MTQQPTQRHYSPDGHWIWDASFGQWRARRSETVIANCRDTVRDREGTEQRMRQHGWWLVAHDAEYKMGRPIVKLTFRRWAE
jgi:hypothetical protein